MARYNDDYKFVYALCRWEKMNVSIYKLGNYKIIESRSGELRWEAHFGLGALQEGICFKKGIILFIGPPENQRDGFLKLEFMDQLKRFPDWLKTKYYCDNVEVCKCDTGKKVAKEEMILWTFDRGINKKGELYSENSDQSLNNISADSMKENLTFRLERYQITKKTDGKIFWKTYAGPNTAQSGDCIVLEDILFIGSWQTDQSSLDKRQFIANLKQLPKWDQTRYYCPTLSLHDCKAGKNVNEEKIKLSSDKITTEKHDIYDRRETSTKLKISNDMKRKILPEKIMPVLDSLAKATESYWNYNHYFRFKFKKSYIPKSTSVFSTSGLRKRAIYIVALIFLIISLCFVFLIGYRKEHHERRHYERDDHHSSHHRDH